MRFPALTRMLGVFLAVVSVLSLVASILGFGRAADDYREQQREDALLDSRIRKAETLRLQLQEEQADYDKTMDEFPDREDRHNSARSDYRMKLATYTATRAGIKLGRKQLDEAAAMLDESMELFRQGLILFTEGKKAFDQIYGVYLVLRDTLDDGLAIYQDAASRVPEGSDEEVTFTPEEILALAELGHRSNAQTRELLESLHDEIPDDQHEAADFVKRAAEEYNEVSPELQDFSVQQLAYGVSQALYDQAAEAMENGIAGGMSSEEARASADRICEESLGLSFDEVGQWLDDNRPADNGGGDGGSISFPPEMLDTLLEQMPGDRELIDVAVGLLDDADRDLSDKEAAYRADPHDMSAAELLLASFKGGLDASQRFLGLVEPTILDTKKQLDDAQHQLAVARDAILDGQKQVRDGYRELDRTAEDLLHKLERMKRRRLRLEKERGELEKLEAVIDGYQDADAQYRTLRAELLGDDAIYDRKEAGEDFLDAAREELTLRVPAHLKEHRLRCVISALMLTAGAFGLLSALGAFEKPRIRRLWLPLLAAIAPTLAAEAISLVLGRGLLYSVLFVGIFSLSLLPLCVGHGKNPAA
ncbi:MAG: hypothetical protein ACSW8E_03130 [Clostridia bacterium]